MQEAIPTTNNPTYRIAPEAEAAVQPTFTGRVLRMANVLLPAATVTGLSALVIVALVSFRETLIGIGNWGYIGVFVAELVNSASIIIPTPGPAYTFAVAPTLNPIVVGLLGGVAASLGELVGYYIGTKGQGAIPQGRMYQKMQSLTSRWGGWALFAFALMPMPFDMAGIWAGITRYPVWNFLFFVAAGKIIKVTMVAMSGAYSISLITQFLG